jgi:hypothetical protein
VCNFLESCGRYLLNALKEKNPQSLTKFNEQIDFMWRLKEKEKISSRQLGSIEQAYYMCRPNKFRSNRILNQNHIEEDLTVIQQFIRHILQTKVKPESISRVGQLMLKLPWISEHDFIMSEFKSLITF